jgi:hypothetical protein
MAGMLDMVIGLAALVGRNTYNFGELLQHPILKVLIGTHYVTSIAYINPCAWLYIGTSHEWIGNMLEAFNQGDIRRFRTIAAESKVVCTSPHSSFIIVHSL